MSQIPPTTITVLGTTRILLLVTSMRELSTYRRSVSSLALMVRPSPSSCRRPTCPPLLLGGCPTASTDPHCTVDPRPLPKVMHTITPPGVSQSNELDYTLHKPVTLQDVVIP